MSRAIVLLLALSSVGGCSPALRGDRFYACADGNCPPGYVCHADARCYRTPEDAAMVPDGSMPRVDAGMMGGACSPMMSGTCSAGQCVVGAWSGPNPSLQCAQATDVGNARHGNSCMMGAMPAQCSAPDACIPSAGGMARCLRPCGPAPYDTCAFNEDCVRTTGGAQVCASSCTSSCVPMFGFTCLGTPAHGNRCLPMNW